MGKLPIMLLAVAAVLTGCGDNFGPQDWNDTPISVRLWSLNRPDLIGLPSAYDFASGRRVVVETPGESGNWDVALSEAESGMVLMPAGAFPDLSSVAGIAVITDQSFDELTAAPKDAGMYSDSASVALEVDGVYVVRTRRFSSGYTTCQQYAKLQVLDIDAAAGSVSFEYVRNPNCGDRSFVPPNSN